MCFQYLGSEVTTKRTLQTEIWHWQTKQTERIDVQTSEHGILDAYCKSQAKERAEVSLGANWLT
jgi:hypothetical protein